MTKADIMKALETKKVGTVMIEFKDDYDLPGRSQLYEWKKKAEAIRKKRWRDNRNNPEKSGKNPEKSDNLNFPWVAFRTLDRSIRSVWGSGKWHSMMAHYETVYNFLEKEYPIQFEKLHPPTIETPPDPPKEKRKIAATGNRTQLTGEMEQGDGWAAQKFKKLKKEAEAAE